TPEAADGGAVAKIREGDIIRLDATHGTLDVLVDEQVWASRQAVTEDLTENGFGLGRELFASLRAAVGAADHGASIIH
ncbi:MAG: dihydroxy-acid dehydratase, partial [Pseudomonadota bacterium]